MNYDVCIAGGLGHVGLPLGIALAKQGKKVVLFDINEKTAEMVQRGEMPFLEYGADEVLKEVINKNLFVSLEKEVIRESKYLVIIIGTPVDKHLNPDFTLFNNFFGEVMDYITDDHHIILRSTVYPGTTEKVQRILKQNGKKTSISFCPERIAEGKAMTELYELPQIISAPDDEGYREAEELFTALTPDIVKLTPLEAEMAKLYTNVWRYITFAVSNQFYQLAVDHDVDFYKIYDAITFKYPRLKGIPRAGFAAGPCLFKDTMQLSAFYNNNFFLGHSSMLINEGLPGFIVNTLKDRGDLATQTVGILGMAFKANSDDKRESLSYKLKKILEVEAGRVLCNDTYFSEEGFVDTDELIAESDIIILGAPHKQYRELEFPENKKVVDIWNFYKKGGLF